MDLATVRGTGPGGRVTEEDMRAAAGPREGERREQLGRPQGECERSPVEHRARCAVAQEPQRERAASSGAGAPGGSAQQEALGQRLDHHLPAVGELDPVAAGGQFAGGPDVAHDHDPVAHVNRFIDIMRHCITLNGSFFNTHRMLQEYVLKAYC